MGDELEIAIDVDDDGARGVAIGEHYVLDDQIAEGGMGRVYRAHHVGLEDRTFAVKLLRGDIAATPEMRQRFLNEASTLRRLAHPNIVSVVDIGQTCGLLYMVMDYAPGISLAELIARGPLPPARAAAIARQLCLGLEHMHDHGVIHRDFKPDNVVVAASVDGDVVRIVDFGLAITDDPSASRVTREGIAVGTPSYIAPEQARGLDLDGRADLFALGISLYEMLAGVLPFSGPPLEVVRLNATEEPPTIAEISGVTVPPALEDIVRRLMARSPEERFASACEVIAALDALAVDAPAEPAVVELVAEAEELEELEVSVRIPLLPLYPTSFVPVRPRRRGPRVALGIAVLAAAGMLGVVVADHGRGDDVPAASAAPVVPAVAPVVPDVAPVAPVTQKVTTPAPAVTEAPAPLPSPTPTRRRVGPRTPPAREPTPETAPAETALAETVPAVVDPFTDH